MLTPTELAASQIMGVAKCEGCKHGSNVTFKGVTTCKHGFSPKHCAVYEIKPEIALRQLQNQFKGD